ncbi:MAG: hypothetical protein ACO1RX_10605 [Candidatus Sericytochromatia bacterium]
MLKLAQRLCQLLKQVSTQAGPAQRESLYLSSQILRELQLLQTDPSLRTLEDALNAAASGTRPDTQTLAQWLQQAQQFKQSWQHHLGLPPQPPAV